MAISAKVDTSKNPIELTVVSDKRVITIDGTASAAGELAPFEGRIVMPVTIADPERTWTKKSDDGVTAVYTS